MQRSIVSAIEAERRLVEAKCELSARMETKIAATLARTWGEEIPRLRNGPRPRRPSPHPIRRRCPLAQHDVKFDVPVRPLGNADVRFIVYRNDDKFGVLRISKGNVEWSGKGKRRRRLNWKRFAALFENAAKRKA